MSPPFTITAFYQFFPVEDREKLRNAIDTKGKGLALIGLILVAKEGINGTVAGSQKSIKEFKSHLKSIHKDILFKDSSCTDPPFRRWHVKIREEIVALGDTSVLPSGKHNYLKPSEWNQMIEKEDVVLLDTRNDYEVDIGTFRGAIDPQLKQFSDFPEYVRSARIPKDKKVLMFCTGGIRCEKALLEMESQGYTHVYQLDGGILKYLEEYPEKHFEGECFVFDHRAAVDQHLEDSKRYSLCPHCGDPGDQRIQCKRCENSSVICTRCAKKPFGEACGKDCANRLACV